MSSLSRCDESKPWWRLSLKSLNVWKFVPFVTRQTSNVNSTLPLIRHCGSIIGLERPAEKTSKFQKTLEKSQVGLTGIEPAHLAVLEPKSSASASSATAPS